MSNLALAHAREFLSVAGYGDENIESTYPVWLGASRGVVLADIVAFGRPAPKDMSTAVITVAQGSVEDAFQIARVIAAPYFIVADDLRLDLWVAEPTRPQRWREALTQADAQELTPWLRPAAALTTKVGLHQLALFDVPVNLLATARSDSADRLGPIVRDALEAASASLYPEPNRDPERAKRKLHRSAARLVVGALTVLVMRDRDRDRDSWRALESDAVIARVVQRQPAAFGWLAHSSVTERSVLSDLVEQLGSGIDYQSLDPTILSQVYEQALVDDDDRKQLGIHYTPPRLATRLLAELPVEIVPPTERHVLDPCCGSGTLLVAAHDRLRELQPSGLAEADRHADLAVHLHGYDINEAAAEIARLTLFLHAQPAGNGWQIEELDTLKQPRPRVAPKLIVTNPPWRFASEGRRAQAADEFLRWSMNALTVGGLLGVLLPASWLSADNSADTRAQLIEQFEVFEIWRLPEGTFATSHVATAALLARKRDGLGGRGARVVREVTRASLPVFLAGEPASISFLTSTDTTPLGEAAPAPIVRASWNALGTIADVLSGTQPLRGIQDRGRGTPYLNQIRAIPPYGVVTGDALWHVDFPGDFQGTRGVRIIHKKKVLASAARSSNSLWRFRVAIDTLGVAVRNSVRGIAPHDQNDEDLLYALAIIVGSGFASSFAASLGGDRNISAEVLKTLPIPTSRASLEMLATLGRQAAQLADDSRALGDHLVDAEQVVWDAYGVPRSDRVAAAARLAGQRAPEGAPRYPDREQSLPPGKTAFRRIGAVLDVAGNDLRIWVNGVTPEEGTPIPFPAQMPGWLARPGATFDVIGVETCDDFVIGRFRLQPMSWQDLNLDKADPEPILPR